MTYKEKIASYIKKRSLYFRTTQLYLKKSHFQFENTTYSIKKKSLQSKKCSYKFQTISTLSSWIFPFNLKKRSDCNKKSIFIRNQYHDSNWYHTDSCCHTSFRIHQATGVTWTTENTSTIKVIIRTNTTPTLDILRTTYTTLTTGKLPTNR